MSYATLLNVRDHAIDGYSNWLWVAQDYGHRVEVMIEIQKLGYEAKDRSGSDTLFVPIGD